MDTKFFPEETLQNFIEIDTALWTTEEPNEEEIVKCILNMNEDDSE